MRLNRRSTMGRMLLITLLTTLLGQAGEALLSVRTLAAEEGDMPIWYVALDGQQYEQLKWSTKQPSPPIMAHAGADLLLYSKVANQEGEPGFKLARKVAIPKAAAEVLLLGWPVNNAQQAGLLAIADDYKKAGFNDCLVINHSDQAVTLRYGKGDAIQLKSGEAKAYRIKGEPDKGSEVIAEAMMKGEMRKIYSTFWAASDKQRFLVLFYSKDGSVKVRRIIDFLQKDEEPER